VWNSRLDEEEEGKEEEEEEEEGEGINCGGKKAAVTESELSDNN